MQAEPDRTRHAKLQGALEQNRCVSVERRRARSVSRSGVKCALELVSVSEHEVRLG